MGRDVFAVANRFWPIVISLMITDFIASLEASMIYGALPTISREFGDYAAVGWLVTAFVLVQAISAAIGGRLGDMFGRLRVLQIVLFISAFGSLICAVSEALELIVLGRCLQGISGAILPLSFGIIRENSSADRAAFGVGMVVGAYSVSGALGFVLGGYFADMGAWRMIFHFTAVAPLFAMLVIYLFVPKGQIEPDTGRGIDYVGAMILAPAVAAILLGFTNIRDAGLLSAPVLGFIGAGIALLAFWIWYELRHPAPLINLRRLKNAKICLAMASFFVLGAGGLQMALILLSLMQQPIWTGVGLGLAAAAAGVAKLPGNIAGVIAGPTGGKIAQRFGSRASALTGFSILVLSWGMLFLDSSGFYWVIVAGIGCNVGVTIVMVSAPTLIMEETPPSEVSEATGFAYLGRAIGMGVGTQIVSILLASATVADPSTGTSFPAAESFRLAIAMVLGLSVIGLLMILAIPRMKRGDKATVVTPNAA